MVRLRSNASRLVDLLSATALIVLPGGTVRAQQAAPANPSTLPPVTVEEPQARPRLQQKRAKSKQRPAAVVRRAPAPQPAPPPPLVESRGPVGTTEGTNSYATQKVTIGKDALSQREIPQSVSVVTRQRIEDQNMTTLEDVARRAPGMVVLQNDRGRSSIFSRGFEFDTFNIDGLPAPLSSVYGTQPDLAPFDRVEILRGPAGLFAGTGEPAGALNLARKRAHNAFAASVIGIGGSWDNYRGEVDVNAPLTANGAVRSRFVAAFQDADSFVNYSRNGVGVAYGTVEIDLTPMTTLSLMALHQERDILPHNGLPAYADGRLPNVDRSTFTGATWNRFGNRTDDYLVELEHRFDNGGRAKASLRYSDREVDMKYAYSGGAIAPATGNFARTTLDREFYEQSLSADAHVSTPFQAWGQTHNVLFGVDMREYQQKLISSGGNALPAGTNNIFNPNPFFAEPTNVPVGTRTEDRPHQYGAYGQLRIKPITPLTLIAGGRLSWYEIDSNNFITGLTTHAEHDAKFIPYLGATFDVTRNISLYGVYTQIFQPQPGSRGADGSVIAPREGTQYEGGVKGEFFDGRLNASVGYFITRDKNRALPTTTPNVSIAAGEAEIQGLEAEVTGKLAPGLQVYAGYAYTVSQHLSNFTASGQTFRVGDTFSTWTPKHNFSLWTKYEFQQAMLAGWHVAGGVRAMSSFYARGATDALRWTEDGYAVVDAQLGYKYNKHIEATFTVSNLFDETYFARVGGATTFNFYGEPRSYWLKVKSSL